MMTTPFQYLLQVSICLFICYAMYYALFKRLTFFSLNRFFLLCSVTVCLIVPAIHITIHSQLPPPQVHQYIAPVKTNFAEREISASPLPQTRYVDWLLMAEIAYALICAGLLGRLFYNIFKLVLNARRNGVKLGSNYVINAANSANASFFNIIFLSNRHGDPLENEQILAHEQAHARLYHSADKLYLQIIKAFLWFNPIIYLMYRDLNEVHEFQVDDSLKHRFNPQAYAMLLLKLSSSPKFSVANQFSALALKSRVRMLFGAKSSAGKRWLYLLILPVLSVMLYSFSFERVYGGTRTKKAFVLVLDAGHGGKESGAIGIGGHREKDMTLLLVNKIKLAAEARGIKVILTRSDDSYLAYKDRVTNNADACISIHMDMTYEGLKDKKSHGILVMTTKNALYPRSKKLALNVMTSLQQLDGPNVDRTVEFNEQQNLHILKDNKAPAVLIEMGYITNPQNVKYALSQEGQHSIAEKIVDAVVNYGNVK